ncbi:hypothetical protein [Asticcacaulis sp. W401b]|uniref:hypothetical protein n=1 Tax=Asticcacaulis sp. W401b TaxID=3388666 RepID=UPI003970E4BD
MRDRLQSIVKAHLLTAVYDRFFCVGAKAPTKRDAPAAQNPTIRPDIETVAQYENLSTP